MTDWGGTWAPSASQPCRPSLDGNANHTSIFPTVGAAPRGLNPGYLASGYPGPPGPQQRNFDAFQRRQPSSRGGAPAFRPQTVAQPGSLRSPAPVSPAVGFQPSLRGIPQFSSFRLPRGGTLGMRAAKSDNNNVRPPLGAARPAFTDLHRSRSDVFTRPRAAGLLGMQHSRSVAGPLDGDVKRGAGEPVRTGGEKPKNGLGWDDDILALMDFNVCRVRRRREKIAEPSKQLENGNWRKDDSDEKVFDDVLNALLSSKGFRVSIDLLSTSLGFPSARIRRLSEDMPNLFEICRKGTPELKLRTTLRVCEDHRNQGCDARDGRCGLHVCYDWVRDSDGDVCVNPDCDAGHDLYTSPNRKALEASGLRDVRGRTLRKILRAVLGRGERKLELCSEYAETDGKCAKTCPKLHLCPGIFLSFCGFENGGKCPLNHNVVDAALFDLYAEVGIDTSAPRAEIETTVSALLENDPLLRDIKTFKLRSTDEEDGDVPELEICGEILLGECPRLLCKKLHASGRKYHWQIRHPAASRWLNLPVPLSDFVENVYGYLEDQDETMHIPHVDEVASEDLLRPFGNVVQLLGRGRLWTVDFSDAFAPMLRPDDGAGGLDLRRLSTPSEGLGPSQWASKFVWYFPDDNGRWVEYGAESRNAHGAKVSKSVVTSAEIEAKFCSGAKTLNFVAGQFSYTIDFTTMCQVNTSTNKARQVLRRPFKQPKVDLEDLLQVPSHWDPMGEEGTLKTVVVQPGSDEFKAVEQTFKARGGIPWSGTITSLTRIQNLVSWTRYQKRRESMLQERGNDPKQVNEQQVFHACRHKDSIEPITREGFTWKRSGDAVGRLFGHGAYFGTTSAESAKYTTLNQMFLAKILVGRPAVGDKNTVKPQPPFDSTTDALVNPRMFVIYDESCMYAEYLVHF